MSERCRFCGAGVVRESKRQTLWFCGSTRRQNYFEYSENCDRREFENRGSDKRNAKARRLRDLRNELASRFCEIAILRIKLEQAIEQLKRKATP